MTPESNYQVYPLTGCSELQLIPNRGKSILVRLVINEKVILAKESQDGKWYHFKTRETWTEDLAIELASRVGGLHIEASENILREVFDQIALDELDHIRIYLGPENPSPEICRLQARTRRVIQTGDDIWIAHIAPPKDSTLNEPQIFAFTRDELENLNRDILRNKSSLMFESVSRLEPEKWDWLRNHWMNVAEVVSEQGEGISVE